MGKTNIEWSDAVWNPSTGCSKVSPGCAHCYAETLTARYAGRPGWPAEFKPWTPANAAENVVLHPDRLEAPFSWRTPRRVFVDSMSDLFHENIPDEFIDQVFAVMALTPQHTYQVLTKRPERMRDYMNSLGRRGLSPFTMFPHADKSRAPAGFRWPIENVWLGVTVENQRWADERIPILLDTPAAVHFVSAEPLLQKVELWRWMDPWKDTGYARDASIDWVIVGGESGSKHRPFDPEWAQSLVDEGHDHGCAMFMKQMGGTRPGSRLDDLPPSLRVREFPDAKR